MQLRLLPAREDQVQIGLLLLELEYFSLWIDMDAALVNAAAQGKECDARGFASKAEFDAFKARRHGPAAAGSH